MAGTVSIILDVDVEKGVGAFKALGKDAQEAFKKIHDTAGPATEKLNAFSTGLSGLPGPMGQAASAAERFGRLMSGPGLIGLAALGATGFGFLAMKTAQAGEALERLHQITGVSVETLSTLKLVADQNKVSLEQTANAVASLQRAMVESQSGNRELRQLFRDLRVEVKANETQFRPVEDVLVDVSKAAQGLGSQSEKVAVAWKLLRAGGAEMLPILEAVAQQGFGVLTEQTRALGVLWTGEQARAAKQFMDQLNRLQTAVTGLAMTVGKLLIPELIKAVDFLDRLFGGKGVKTDEDKLRDRLRDVTSLLQQAQSASKNVISGFFQPAKIAEEIRQLTAEKIAIELTLGALEEARAATKDKPVLTMTDPVKVQEALAAIQDVLAARQTQFQVEEAGLKLLGATSALTDRQMLESRLTTLDQQQQAVNQAFDAELALVKRSGDAIGVTTTDVVKKYREMFAGITKAKLELVAQLAGLNREETKFVLDAALAQAEAQLKAEEQVIEFAKKGETELAELRGTALEASLATINAEEQAKVSALEQLLELTQLTDEEAARFRAQIEASSNLKRIAVTTAYYSQRADIQDQSRQQFEDVTLSETESLEKQYKDLIGTVAKFFATANQGWEGFGEAVRKATEKFVGVDQLRADLQAEEAQLNLTGQAALEVAIAFRRFGKALEELNPIQRKAVEDAAKLGIQLRDLHDALAITRQLSADLKASFADLLTGLAFGDKEDQFKKFSQSFVNAWREAFSKTLVNKMKDFDLPFSKNVITDLPGFVAQGLFGPNGVVDLFSRGFEAILGEGNEFSKALSALMTTAKGGGGGEASSAGSLWGKLFGSSATDSAGAEIEANSAADINAVMGMGSEGAAASGMSWGSIFGSAAVGIGAGIMVGGFTSRMIDPTGKETFSKVGGQAGAVIGAAIGTAIFPGVGTIIGGILGGFLGALIGGLIKKGAPLISQALQQMLNETFENTGAEFFNRLNFPGGRLSVAQFERTWKPILEAAQKSLTAAIQAGMKEAFTTGDIKKGVAVFAVSLREGLKEGILQGIIQGFANQVLFLRVIAPSLAILEQSFQKAMEKGIFDTVIFAQGVQLAMQAFANGLNAVRPALEQLFQTAIDMVQLIDETFAATGIEVPEVNIDTGPIEDLNQDLKDALALFKDLDKTIVSALLDQNRFEEALVAYGAQLVLLQQQMDTALVEMETAASPQAAIAAAQTLEQRIIERYQTEIDFVTRLKDLIDSLRQSIEDAISALLEITLAMASTAAATHEAVATLLGAIAGFSDVQIQVFLFTQLVAALIQEIEQAVAAMGPFTQVIADFNAVLAQVPALVAAIQSLSNLQTQVTLLQQLGAALISLLNATIAAIQSYYRSLRDQAQKAAQERIDQLNKERDLIQEQIDLARDWNRILDSVAKQLLALQTGLLAPPSPMAAFGVAQSSFQAALAAFRAAPTPETAQAVIDATNTLLQVAEQIFARPSPQYAALFDQVVAALDAVKSVATVQSATLDDLETELKAIDDAIKQTQDALQATLERLSEEEQATIQAAQDAINAQLAVVQAALLEATLALIQQQEEAAALLAATIGEGNTYENFIATKSQEMVDALALLHADLAALLSAQGIAVPAQYGLDVTRDTIVRAHRGEKVLTAAEARAYREGGGGLTLIMQPGSIVVNGAKDPEATGRQIRRQMTDWALYEGRTVIQEVTGRKR